jgi:hypothetical protein
MKEYLSRDKDFSKNSCICADSIDAHAARLWGPGVRYGRGHAAQLPRGSEQERSEAERVGASLEADGRISNRPTYSPGKRKRGRLFQRLKSGMTWHRGDRLRFMTLTTAPEAVERNFGKDWNLFVTRLRKYTPMRLLQEDYITWTDLKRYYRSRPYGKGPCGTLVMDYCAVQTWEGNGVKHCAIYGDYLPQAFISDLWDSCHHTKIVDIRSPKGTNGHQLSSYFLGQYIADQDMLNRYSWSRDWVYRGFCRQWSQCWKQNGFVPGLDLWYDSMVRNTFWQHLNGWQRSLDSG